MLQNCKVKSAEIYKTKANLVVLNMLATSYIRKFIANDINNIFFTGLKQIFSKKSRVKKMVQLMKNESLHSVDEFRAIKVKKMLRDIFNCFQHTK